MVRAASLAELGFDAVDAALRLPDAATAAEIWEAVEQRVIAGGEWGWALNVCGRLLGDEEGAVDRASPLRSHVRATHTSALLHLRDEDLTEAWEEVASTAGLHPDPEGGRLARVAGRLRQDRCRSAFQARARAAGGIGIDRIDARRSSPRADRPLRSRPSKPGWMISSRIRTGWIELWSICSSQRNPQRTCSLMPCCCGDVIGLVFRGGPRRRRSSWTPSASRRRLSDAVRGPAGAAPTSFVSGFVSSSCVRCLARFTVQVTMNFGPGRRTPNSISNTADGERLVALILENRLADGWIPKDELRWLTKALVYDPDRRPRCRAHEAVPPLFTMLALGWAALGEVDHAPRAARSAP